MSYLPQKQVEVTSSVLPTGAATSALQTQISAKLPTISSDSFHRVRVSSPAFRFDDQLTYKVNTDAWDVLEAVSGTVAHSSTLRAAVLTAAASIGSKAVLQSHYNCPYTPGRSQLAKITFIMGATPSAGVSRRAGYYDEALDVGVYLEQTSSGVNLVLKTGGTGYANQSIPQASWNIDTLGAGALNPSGITLNLVNAQILIISLQALYAGTVHVAFDVAGELVPVHNFNHSNAIAYPYIAQASLPIHYSIRTTAAAGGTMTAICASCASEGGDRIDECPGRSFSVGNGVTSIGVTARRPILTIRPKQQFNSINQNALIVPTVCEILARTNDGYIEVVRNGSLTGATYAAGDVDAALSVAEYDIAANAISGGQVLSSFYVPASATLRNSSEKSLAGKALLCYSHLTGVADTLSIVVTARTGTCDVHGALKWTELR